VIDLPRRNLKTNYKEIARERIERLFELAEQVFHEDRKLANRYVELSWRIATRYNVRIPPHLKRKFCRKCLSYLVPGASCSVRTRSKPRRLIITCFNCGHIVRLPLENKRANMDQRKE